MFALTWLLAHAKAVLGTCQFHVGNLVETYTYLNYFAVNIIWDENNSQIIQSIRLMRNMLSGGIRAAEKPSHSDQIKWCDAKV